MRRLRTHATASDVAWAVVTAVVGLSLFGGGLFVIVHFIVKFW